MPRRADRSRRMHFWIIQAFHGISYGALLVQPLPRTGGLFGRGHLSEAILASRYQIALGGDFGLVLVLGVVSAALTAYQASLAIRERLAQQDPDNAQ